MCLCSFNESEKNDDDSLVFKLLDEWGNYVCVVKLSLELVWKEVCFFLGVVARYKV